MKKEVTTMLKAMIVDDDMLIRSMLRSFVDWHEQGFDLVDEAVDGVDAIEKIENQVPDLLVLDISMPQMDGLEVIRYIRNKGLEIKIIVLSCHDEFPYVKEAMFLNADEYLLKHMLSPENIVEAVGKMREKIAEERTMKKSQIQKQKRIEEGMRLLRSESLIRLLRASGITKDIIDSIGRYDQELLEENYSMIRFKVKNYVGAVKEFDPNGEEIMVKVIDNILSEIASESFEFKQVYMGQGEFVMLVHLSTSSQARVKRELETMVKRLEYALDSFVRIKTEFVLSTETLSYRQFAQSYRKLVDISKNFFYDDASILIDGFSKPVKMGKLKVSVELTDKIKTMLEKNQFDNIAEAVKDEHEVMRDVRVDPEAMIDWYLELSRNLWNFTAFRFKVKIDSEKRNEFVERIKSSDNDKVLFQSFKAVVGYIQSLLASDLYEDVDNKYIKEALRYIQSHYMDNLSLSELADHLRVNSAYLSHLFKESTDRNFVDYVKEIRIRKACEFLDHSDMKIKDVGEAVGIPNRKYFSKTFKKVVGLTPQEYKTKSL